MKLISILSLFLSLLFSYQMTAFNLTGDTSVKWVLDCDDYNKCQRLFKENFVDNKNKWPLVYDEKKGIAEINATQGLHIVSKNKDNFAQWVKADINRDENFSIEAEISKIKGSAKSNYGIIYGFKDWDNFHYFYITPTGFYSYGIRLEGLNLENRRSYFSQYIKIKKSESNKIKVNKAGQKLYLSVNGEILESLDYTKITGKRFGICATGDKAEISVKNFNIRADKTMAVDKYSESADKDFIGSGSGVIMSKNGYIATNYHVIENASEVFVELPSENTVVTYKADIIQKDQVNDLAILKINDKNFKSRISDMEYCLASKTCDVGTQVFTLGYPMALNAMGKEVKFTDGKISSKTGFRGELTSYQITVPVQPGNSGGPLFDNDGNLIGLVNAKIKEGDNVSYAVKVVYLRNLSELLPESLVFSENSPIKNLSSVEKIKTLSKYAVLIKIK